MAAKNKKTKGKKAPVGKKSVHSKISPHAKPSSHGENSSNNKKKGAQKTDTQTSKHSEHMAVYIDVEFDSGLLYLVLVNGADVPATQVSVDFDKPLYGANGTDLSGLGIFKHLAFLRPHKQIRVFLDDAQAYYARRQRSVVKFNVSWRIDKRRFTATISHDMRAYADFTYIIDQSDNRRLGHARL